MRKLTAKVKIQQSENDDNINNEGDIQDEFAYLNETAVQWLERNWNDNTFYK